MMVRLHMSRSGAGGAAAGNAGADADTSADLDADAGADTDAGNYGAACVGTEHCGEEAIGGGKWWSGAGRLLQTKVIDIVWKITSQGSRENRGHS